MTTVDFFRSFSAESVDVDQLVALHAFGKQLRAEFEALGVDEPEYVDSQLKAIRREINTRNADRIDQRIREVKSRLDALKSPDVRRQELEKELEKLQSKVGV